MTRGDWSAIYARLAVADSDSLVRTAHGAAAAVLTAWTGAVPSGLSAVAVDVLAALEEWRSTGKVRSGVKEIAARAYAAVGASGLPPCPARRAGLAVAHAGFALHFWSIQDRDKVFAAARDAISNARWASCDPSFEDQLVRIVNE